MTETAPFPTLEHDHADCVRTALDQAEEHCERNGARLTAIRRHVLELVWKSHAPVGAYALLDALNAEGHNAAPPTVYRALDFLMEQGLVHRVESLNAYLGCAHPEESHAALLLLCTGCGRAAEFEDDGIDERLRRAASSRGFTVARQTIEVEGLCPACQDATAKAKA
ncbi:MAG TPA: Fur family transcriptional regulator [Magnetospirillaceae bacterium]|jgi:Fur family zinc uptake transcriptional regulator